VHRSYGAATPALRNWNFGGSLASADCGHFPRTGVIPCLARRACHLLELLRPLRLQARLCRRHYILARSNQRVDTSAVICVSRLGESRRSTRRDPWPCSKLSAAMGPFHGLLSERQTRLPGKYQPLLTFLEPCIYDVEPPDADGVFHPKVWALRLLGPGGEIRYRVLCLSRNLTFDRCWTRW